MICCLSSISKAAYEEHIEGGVGGVEGVVDTLSEENTAKIMGAPGMHKLGGSPGIVPVLAVVFEHPEVESLGKET